MKWRRLHRWISIIVCIPLIVIAATGTLLLTRGFNHWLVPEFPGGGRALHVSFEGILASLQKVKEVPIRSWDDVGQIDVRPQSGQIRVRTKTGNWEVQLDGGTGEILGVVPRRMSWIIAIHDGTIFGNPVAYAVYLPAALGLLVLLFTGILLILQPWRKKKSVVARTP